MSINIKSTESCLFLQTKTCAADGVAPGVCEYIGRYKDCPMHRKGVWIEMFDDDRFVRRMVVSAFHPDSCEYTDRFCVEEMKAGDKCMTLRIPQSE